MLKKLCIALMIQTSFDCCKLEECCYGVKIMTVGKMEYVGHLPVITEISC